MVKNLFFACSILALSNSIFAEETKGFSYSLKVDGAYYIESDYQKGKSHFAEPTGPYDGVLARGTLNATYTLPTPLGQSELLSEANVEFKGSLEISPLTIRPIFSIDFTPLPFLVFEVGSSIGTGWNMLGFEGFCKYKNGDYRDITPFTQYYHNHWVNATLQFDFGEIFEGDWNHVIMMATYEMFYQGITGLDKGQLWAWQNTDGYINGLGYDIYTVLAYKMPLFVDMIGFTADFYGQYSSKDYGDIASTYGKFMTIELSVFAELAFNKTNSLIIGAYVSSRRSFATDHKESKEEPYLVKSGREWFFDCLILSWEHKF
jgi:hypothetical protein